VCVSLKGFFSYSMEYSLSFLVNDLYFCFIFSIVC